mgnify:FL=1
MYSTYIGQNKSLVFPVMCSGYVTLDYSDNVVDDAGTDNVYGIWDDYDSFTFEAIITPYDVVGNATHPNNISTKTMPSRSTGQGYSYLSSSNRLSYKMCLYSCSAFEVRLANTQSSSASAPAEYRIESTILLGSTEYTCNSSTCIVSTAGKKLTTEKENVYSHTPFHVLVTYNNNSKNIMIFVNGINVGEQTFDTNDDFVMGAEDVFIGVDHSQFSNTDANTRKQFMGEIHELSISNINVERTPRRFTLHPQLHNTLLYLRFEEADE